MQRRTWFTNNSFPKCSRANIKISFIQSCCFLMQSCLRVQRTRSFNDGFPTWPLHAEISLNLLMISVWSLKSLQLCHLWNIVFKLLDYLSTQVFTKWWTSLHPCLWKTEPFKDAPLKSTHDAIICYKLTCLPVEYYKQVFFEHSTAFPVFCCSLSQLFWNLLLPLNSEYAYIYKNPWSWWDKTLFIV